MKISFSKTRKFTPEFNNNMDLPEAHRFTADIKVCEMGDLLAAVDAFKSISGGKDQIETSDLNAEATATLVKTVGALLPAYVTVNNLRGEDDVELTVQDIVSYGPLFPLAAELLAKLVEFSTPTAEEEGN